MFSELFVATWEAMTLYPAGYFAGLTEPRQKLTTFRTAATMRTETALQLLQIMARLRCQGRGYRIEPARPEDL